MNRGSTRIKQQEWLRQFVQVGSLALFVVILTAPGSPARGAQTFDQAVFGACAVVSAVCSSASSIASSGSTTALTRQTSPVEERRVPPRLVGSLSPWFSGEYERFDKNVTKFEPGYKTDTGRASIGADYAFYDHRLVLGGAFSYAKVSGNFNSGGRLDTDSYGALLYATIVPAPKSFIDVTAGYTRKDYFLSRRVFDDLTLLGTNAGDTDGNEFTVGASGGYDFTFDNVTIGPRLDLNYKRNEINGYRERGRGDGLPLIYNSQTENSLTSALGLYASVAISTSFGVLVPQATVKYLHEFADSQRRIKFRAVEDPSEGPFSFQTDRPDPNYFHIGAGIAMVLPHKLQPFINYRALLGYKDQSSHIVTAGLRVAF